MFNRRFFNLCLVTLCCAAVACASTTLIRTQPDGAEIFANGALLGPSPVEYSDTKVVFTNTTIIAKHPGCKDATLHLERNEKAQVGPIVGAVFCFMPFALWALGYNPDHLIRLECGGGGYPATHSR